ncbi:MAG: mechanosensitive ion channel family protein [Deltaproteobacteria bacterium]|nr:MAG: mechanosensitive ion channel family protein [Deltaproteobacteria bacterium]
MQDAPTDNLLDPNVVPPWLVDYLPFAIQVLLAAAILAAAWIASRWARGAVRAMLERRNVDTVLRGYVAGVVQWSVLLVGVAAALEKAGVPATSFLALLGSAGVAVGLALQGNLSQLASGVMILVFRPFTADDFITVAGISGDVKQIGLLHTVLQSPDLETVYVPNNTVMGNPIVNHTRLGVRRAKIVVGVAYGTDVARAASVATAAAKTAPLVLADPEPFTLLTNFGASSLDLTIFCFARREDFVRMQDEVRRAVYGAFEREGIEIPFDQIVVHQADAAA